MDNKDNFHIFCFQKTLFVFLVDKIFASGWMRLKINSISVFILRSLRFKAIPMLIESDIELKYSQVREYIQTFDDFYVFLLSLYEPEFSTSEEAQF